jgi:hypothetical protein
MSQPGRSPKAAKASRLRRAMRMLTGSENCARTPPAARLVEPEASASRSTSSTSATPASARWKAMLAPMTPPPTTTTEADAGSGEAVTPAA